MSSSQIHERLPTAIEHKLRWIRRRQVALTTTRGIAIGLGVLALGLVLAMTIDWLLTLFSASTRLILTCATIATAIGAATFALVGPLRRARDIRHAARCVDAQVPNLQQRWTTVASLSQSDQGPVTAAEHSMREQVTSEAVAMHSLVKPKLLVPLSLARRPLVGLGLCVMVLVTFMALNPQQTSVLWQRFWSPTKNITATILLNEDTPLRVPRGELVELAARQSGVPRNAAKLLIEYPSGQRETFAVSPHDDDALQFVHTLRADESFRYRMRAGDGQTDWRSLQVIDYPEIGEVQFKVIAPAYVGREDTEKEFIPRRITVSEGTLLQIAIRPKEPVARLVVSATTQQAALNTKNQVEQTEEIELTADSDGWHRYEQVLNRDVLIEPRLYSEHGLKNEGRTTCRIETIADAAPVARVIRPTEEIAVADDEVIEIEFEAHDDHGIARAELVIYDDSQLDAQGQPMILETREIPLGDQLLEKHLVSSTKLDLKELDLNKDAQISYSIRVTDNRDSGGDQPNDKDYGEDGSSDGDSSEDGSSESELAREDAGEDSREDTPDDARQDVREDVRENAPGDASSIADDFKPDDNSKPGDNFKPSDNSIPSDKGESSSIADDSKPGDKSRQDENLIPNDNGDAKANAEESAKLTPSELAAMAEQMQPRPNAFNSRQGQNTETSRLRLKITERLDAIAAAATNDRKSEPDIRDRIVEIDRHLAVSQTSLKSLVDKLIPVSNHDETLSKLDVQIGSIETLIADLRTETRNNEFAFVGLQMIDISQFHITPARDRIFAATQRPGASEQETKVALGHINRAREQLARLLKQYDRVKQDRDLKESIDESITIYEVYVERSQQLLREARQNRNPMTRKMAIIEVDQDYLDRLAEVLRLRRDMMSEFGEMLGDDPRLMSRYMDLVQRRGNTLRSRLSELAERQYEATTEMRGWIEIDEQQRGDLWTIIVDLRLAAAEKLASNVADFAERVTRQMPLVADIDRGTPASIIRQADEMTQVARSLAMDCEKLPGDPDAGHWSQLQAASDKLSLMSATMQAYLDQFQIEHEDDEEITAYVGSRLLENRITGAAAESWAITVQHLAGGNYAPIAAAEQHAIAIDTQTLRIEMQNIQEDLADQFLRASRSAGGGATVPDEITNLASQLQRLMESITMNQVAAIIAARQDDLKKVGRQQQLALDRFDEAEQLFDLMRRAVADALDEFDVEDPNIAELVDPTLDEFLARLEREATIADQLGLPNRERNLRVLSESLDLAQEGAALLGSSGEAAIERAKKEMKKNPLKPKSGDPDDDAKKNGSKNAENSKPMTDEQRERIAAAKKQQEKMEKTLLEIESLAASEQQSSEERNRLKQIARQLREIMESDKQDEDGSQVWQRIAQSDQADAILAAIRRGESLPDEQWNKLTSTLEDGLWQVRGTQPPEAYRKAIQNYQDTLRELVGSQR